MKTNKPSLQDVWDRYEDSSRFKRSIGLYDTVRVNENYFIGNQWEDVQANGLPTPVFNFLKRVTLFQVATITSDNMAIQASPLPSTSRMTQKQVDQITEIVNHQFAAIFERNRIVTKIREFLRNAAVDGDGCMYFYFDPSVENGQNVKGEICAEILENVRVHFGNPNCRDVQKQPWIILSRRMTVEDAQYTAEQNGVEDAEAIKADDENFDSKYDRYTKDKVTVLTHFYRNRKDGHIWCIECCRNVAIREAYDTGYTLYPVIWQCWDYIPDCYHGQALITGLLPNQNFVNKIFALTGVSLLTTAFPKVIYDKNRIRSWDASVGSAVGVAGGVDGVATILNPASVNPQIAQFIELAVSMTQEFLGASEVAMGNSRPDNTSAIIALQRAANTPMELVKQNLYQAVEDMGRIFMDMMSAKYGERYVETSLPMEQPGKQPLGMTLQKQTFVVPFDFSVLKEIPVSVKLDVGASAYWSEVASMQTLDNLLMNNRITMLQYLERLPQGYIAKKQELIDELTGAAPVAGGPATTSDGAETQNIDEIPVQGGPGNGALQRALNETGVV